MKVVGADVLAQAQRCHAEARGRLSAWKAEVEAACWRSFKDITGRFPATDRVGKRYVFDIGGNRYRLVAGVDFETGVVRVRWFGTHAEYDKIKVDEV